MIKFCGESGGSPWWCSGMRGMLAWGNLQGLGGETLKRQRSFMKGKSASSPCCQWLKFRALKNYIEE